MKIAFTTMHAARNYGAVLQTYALQKVLNQMRSEERRVEKECRSRWSPYH